MAGKKCPSCRNVVPAEARACSFCPYSFPEEEEVGIEQVRQQQSWSPLPLFLGLSAAAVVAALYMTLGQGGKNISPRMVSTAKSPRIESPRATAAVEQAPSFSAQPAEHDREEVSLVVISPTEEEKPVPVVKEWKMRGMVYDLLTLSPIPKCRVVFSDEQANARFETVADATGRYRMILPALKGRGYSVKISQPGYAASYVDPVLKKVRELPESERLKMSRELSGSIMPPFTLTPRGGAPLVTDFYLAPLE